MRVANIWYSLSKELKMFLLLILALLHFQLIMLIPSSKWRMWITISKTVNLFIIEKSRPKHDPKRTRLCDLLPTGSTCRWWRGLNSKTTQSSVVVENCEVASSSSFWDIQKYHFVTAAEAADIDESINTYSRRWGNLHKTSTSACPLANQRRAQNLQKASG